MSREYRHIRGHHGGAGAGVGGRAPRGAPGKRPLTKSLPVQRRADSTPQGPSTGGSRSSRGLPDGLHALTQRAFNFDFSGVRIREDDQAPAMGAVAYTQGADLHFTPGAYDPSSPQGQALIGHELAHVVQQSEGRVTATRQAKGIGINEDDQLEREADAWGARAMRGEAIERSGTATGPAAFGPVQMAGGMPHDGEFEHTPLDATTVIVQADFMSGDSNSVAAALTLDSSLGVILLTSSATRSNAEQLMRYYNDAMTRSGDQSSRVGIVEVDDPKQAYLDRTKLEDDTFLALLGDADPVGVTHGTRIVADNFWNYAGSAADEVPAYLAQRWFGEPRDSRAPQERTRDAYEQAHHEHVDVLVITDASKAALFRWLMSKGIGPGKYAFIWAKTGAPEAEKAHHFTDLGATKQLIELALDQGRTPILVGDDIGAADYLRGRGVHLGKFWSDPSFPFRHEGRLGQLRLYRYLVTEAYDAVNIGMRSGALEGPALMGMETIYLEEQGNEQARRMEKWLETMPNYRRAILSSTPGSPQLRHLAGIVARIIDRAKAQDPPYIDGVVPDHLRGAYVKFLEEEKHRLESLADRTDQGAISGFAREDLHEIQVLLATRKLDLEYDEENVSYAKQFMQQCYGQVDAMEIDAMSSA